MSKRSEQEFFDHSFATSSRRGVWKFYALMKASEEHYKRLLREAAPGARVLEYGCGLGSMAFELASVGREVVGIDISTTAIDKATRKAQGLGLANCRFLVADAERMSFPDAAFDLVCGTGILHHLDVGTAARELGRILRPGGRAVFMEPLGHNPGLKLFRRLTPRLRTADEHPLVRRDLQVLRAAFGTVRIRYFHLLSFLSLPLLPTRQFHPARRLLDAADARVFTLAPALGLLAWYAVIELAEPGRRAAAPAAATGAAGRERPEGRGPGPRSRKSLGIPGR